MKRSIILLSICTVFTLPVQASDYKPAMQEYIDYQLDWLDESVLIEAIEAQNAKTVEYDQSMIDGLDKKWRAEVDATVTPTITPVLNNEAAEFLRERIEDSNGTITEVFIMDAKGLNVAVSHITSDMWQGDEAKFTETYAKGSDARHFGDVEFDESSQSLQGQISLSIADPESGDVIGAITIGVDADELL